MKVVYIGHYEPGSTSRMRGEYLRKLLQPEKFIVADISIPIGSTNKIFRSIGWRFYKGPLIDKVNTFCDEILVDENDIDIVWIDKGVFLKPCFVQKLKQRAQTLIHYTPDTAFFCNRSRLFFEALPHYNYCLTTKSFEINEYKNAGAQEVIYCTQGYDPLIHKPGKTINKKKGVAFAGLCEPYREAIMASLLEEGVTVKIAGMNWEKFVRRNKTNKNLQFYGTGLFGRDYAGFYSESQIGLGLMSKRFMELHTTRLFEIPACGTAMVTERNYETTGFFTEDEVIFYDDIKEMTERIIYALAHPQYIDAIAQKGNEKVTRGGFDYESIIRSLLKQTRILS